MGQYHKVFNLSKKQMLHPHKLGDGLKLREFGNSSGGTMCALAYLLGCSTGRGGGDFQRGALAGTWAGDRITIIGDYAVTDDMRNSTEQASRETDAAVLYNDYESEGEGEITPYKDISDLVRAECSDISSPT